MGPPVRSLVNGKKAYVRVVDTDEMNFQRLNFLTTNDIASKFD